MDPKLFLFVIISIGVTQAHAVSRDESENSNPFFHPFFPSIKPIEFKMPKFPEFPKIEFPKIEIPTITPGPNAYQQGVSVVSFTHGGNDGGETIASTVTGGGVGGGVGGGGSTVVIRNNGKVTKWVNGEKVEE